VLREQIGLRAACDGLGVPRSAHRRAHDLLAPVKQLQALKAIGRRAVEPTSPRGISAAEKAVIRETLNSERFQDQSPREVYSILLEEERYLCHWRSMYRILNEHDEVHERRNQRRRPAYIRPELLATRPNSVWSWDISAMRGPAKWQHFWLYVIIDIFSRHIVGWLIADEISTELAEQLVNTACEHQHIQRQQLTLHADNGGPMKAKSMAQLMIDLGILKSHSRPHVSDDNPFSEAQFKTMKYRSDYPDRFDSIDLARAWMREFVDWYNHHHHHTALALLTPATVHSGQTLAVLARRQATLDAAFARHPLRFIRHPPLAPVPPAKVWINPPKSIQPLPLTELAIPLLNPDSSQVALFGIVADCGTCFGGERCQEPPAGGAARPLLLTPLASDESCLHQQHCPSLLQSHPLNLP
jgi:putative transposase